MLKYCYLLTYRFIQVANREQCLSACLKEKEFVCRSVNYNYDSFLCELSTEDRRFAFNRHVCISESKI